MKKRTSLVNFQRISICVLVTIIVFGITANGYPGEVRGVTDTMIKVGGILDQTGPSAGDIALPITEALRIYTMHINDSGGIFGRKVKFIVEDDRYSIPAGIAAFKKLLFKDMVLALVGPVSVGETKALFGQIDKLKVPTITGGPDESVVYPVKKYIFLPTNVYLDQIGVIFDYIINDLKPKKIAITFVYPDVESGKGGLVATKKWATYFNVDLNTEVLNLGALDATSQVMNIKRKPPTHIIIHHGSAGAALLLRDLKKIGVDIPVYGIMPTCMEDTVRMAGSASKNYIGATPPLTLVQSWRRSDQDEGDYPEI